MKLQQLLKERFRATIVPSEKVYLTGLPLLDEIGIPQAAITEIVSSSGRGSGDGLFLYSLLQSAAQQGERVALIDGSNSFRPRALQPNDLSRLLWMRCLHAGEAFRAVDLVARDGNFPLILLLLTLNPVRELRRIPSTSWHRLQMLLEKSAATLVVMTPFAQVGSARLRLSVKAEIPLRRLHRRRSELLASLGFQMERRREGRWGDEALCRAVCA